MRCDTCPYWRERDPEVGPGGVVWAAGACRADKPDGSRAGSFWPMTRASDSCGCHPEAQAARDRAAAEVVMEVGTDVMERRDRLAEIQREDRRRWVGNRM